MRFLLCGINAKYIHSNLAIFSLKAYADRKKIPGAEIILKEYTINNYVEDILQDLYEEKADVVIFSCYIWNISFVRELAAELKILEGLRGTPFTTGQRQRALRSLALIEDIIRLQVRTV